jgi:hypothetical protein
MDETIQCIEILAPFLSRAVITELCSGRKALSAWREKKLQEARIRYELAMRRQLELGRRNQQREMRFVDGPGYHRLTLDEELEMRVRTTYGRTWFQDKKLVRRLEQDHPEVCVPRPPRRFHHVNGFKRPLESAPAVVCGEIPQQKLKLENLRMNQPAPTPGATA